MTKTRATFRTALAATGLAAVATLGTVGTAEAVPAVHCTGANGPGVANAVCISVHGDGFRPSMVRMNFLANNIALPAPHGFVKMELTGTDAAGRAYSASGTTQYNWGGVSNVDFFPKTDFKPGSKLCGRGTTQDGDYVSGWACYKFPTLMS